MAKYNNIGMLFYKKYYGKYNEKDKDIDFRFVVENEESIKKSIKRENAKTIAGHNKEIKESVLYSIKPPISGLDTFTATVLYPGLVTGTGLVHDSNDITGGYNLGMHFDYTTGMPIVYGSSVKGVLRQYFVDFCKDKLIKEKNMPEKDAKESAAALKKVIFDGKDGKKDLKENLPMYKRDVFFDAVITQPNKNFLADDYITPHKEGPLKEPTPLAMLKIAAGCTLEFRFLLHDSEIGEKTYDKAFKLKVFKEILGTVGIGAKTNVGYGQLK